jgi:endonuclease-3
LSQALGIACGEPKISGDVHVDRIVNRWGYVATPTPEQTTVALSPGNAGSTSTPG